MCPFLSIRAFELAVPVLPQEQVLRFHRGRAVAVQGVRAARELRQLLGRSVKGFARRHDRRHIAVVENEVERLPRGGGRDPPAYRRRIGGGELDEGRAKGTVPWRPKANR